MKLTRFWIIGAGRFGRLAVERITRHITGATITVVEDNPTDFDIPGVTTVREDGIGWLYRMLNEDSHVDMIVPAIPIHVAAEWLKLKLAKEFEMDAINIPEPWLAKLPNTVRGKNGQMFVSHADFICPDNCPEPKKICTYTGKSRPMDLFRLLGNFKMSNVFPIVLRSYQLLPGVGGLYPPDLLDAVDIARKNSHLVLMISTACRCHGVADFLWLKNKDGVNA
jgi:hypothetical protein